MDVRNSDSRSSAFCGLYPPEKRVNFLLMLFLNFCDFMSHNFDFAAGLKNHLIVNAFCALTNQTK